MYFLFKNFNKWAVNEINIKKTPKSIITKKQTKMSTSKKKTRPAMTSKYTIPTINRKIKSVIQYKNNTVNSKTICIINK